MSNGYYVLKQTTNKEWMFNLKASNHEVILTSERYTSKAMAQHGISSVQSNSPYDHNYNRLTSTGGQPYFTLKASNGQVIGVSEMYSSAQARENGIASVKKNGPTTTIIEV